MLKKLIRKFNKLILGDNWFAPLRKRLFILIVWGSFLLSIMGNAVNIALNFPTILITVTGIISIVLFAVFFHIRTNSNVNYELYHNLFWLIVILVIPVTWFMNAGIDGNNIMMIFVIFIGMFLTVKPTYRFATFVFFILLITGLLIVDFYYPNLIVRYSSKEQRMADLFLGYGLYLTLTYSLLDILIKNIEYEGERKNLRNKQLDLLTREKDTLNTQLIKTIEELEQSNSSKDRFISIIAHDLRSPFQGLLAISNLLDTEYESFGDDEKKQLIGKLSQSLEKQYGFIEELLLWGRIQRNAIHIAKEDVSINEVIKSVVNFASEEINKKRINVEINYCKCDSFITDRNLVATVLRNILSNAIKFSPVNSKIIIIASSDNETVSVLVQDFGIGISDSDKVNLFNVDRSVSRRGTDGETGTGLGLIVCAEIIKKLNGSIHVISKEGKGTTFKVDLPLNLE